MLFVIDSPFLLKSHIKLKFRSIYICGGRKTREPVENPQRKDENQQQIQHNYYNVVADPNMSHTSRNYMKYRWTLSVTRKEFNESSKRYEVKYRL